MTEALSVAKKPCPSCPYRCDAPSGLWAQEEYEKLPRYDGETWDQHPATFYCHQQDGNLCAGWLGTHGAPNLLALRLNPKEIPDEVWDYKSPVPVFASGAEAAKHGMRDVDAPSPEARKMIDRLSRAKTPVPRTFTPHQQLQKAAFTFCKYVDELAVTDPEVECWLGQGDFSGVGITAIDDDEQETKP
jgi:hypothetical protein